MAAMDWEAGAAVMVAGVAKGEGVAAETAGMVGMAARKAAEVRE